MLATAGVPPPIVREDQQVHPCLLTKTSIALDPFHDQEVRSFHQIHILDPTFVESHPSNLFKTALLQQRNQLNLIELPLVRVPHRAKPFLPGTNLAKVHRNMLVQRHQIEWYTVN